MLFLPIYFVVAVFQIVVVVCVVAVVVVIIVFVALDGFKEYYECCVGSTCSLKKTAL